MNVQSCFLITPILQLHFLKKRLMKFAKKYPKLCRMVDDDGIGGMAFEVDRKRFGFRLTAPYTAERKKAASELAKKRGMGGNIV